MRVDYERMLEQFKADLKSAGINVDYSINTLGVYIDLYVYHGDDRYDLKVDNDLPKNLHDLFEKLIPKNEKRENVILKYFKFNHLPDHLIEISKSCSELAYKMEAELSDGPEKSAGLRKLLEAKDCFVRSMVK